MTVLQHLQSFLIERHQELDDIEYSLEVEKFKFISGMRKDLEVRKAYLEILIKTLEEGMAEFGVVL